MIYDSGTILLTQYILGTQYNVFPAQMASYAENVCIWWRHHAKGSNRILQHVIGQTMVR